jgi:hypothetical protein
MIKNKFKSFANYFYSFLKILSFGNIITLLLCVSTITLMENITLIYVIVSIWMFIAFLYLIKQYNYYKKTFNEMKKSNHLDDE